MPAEKVPAEKVLTEKVPVEKVPTDNAPAESAPVENAPAKKLAPNSTSETTPIDIEKPTLKPNLEISEPKAEVVSSSKVETVLSSIPDVSKVPIIEKEDTTSSGVAFDELGG